MPKREFTFVPKSSANYDPSKSVEVTDKPPTEADVGVLEEGVAHTGAPAVNVEVMLRGVVDELVEEGGEDAQGEVWIRGPGVLGNGCVPSHFLSVLDAVRRRRLTTVRLCPSFAIGGLGRACKLRRSRMGRSSFTERRPLPLLA